MKNILLIVAISLIPFLSLAQENWCSVGGAGNVTIPIGVTNNSSNTEYQVRVYLHIVKNANGTKGVSVTDALTAYNEMANDYAPHGICFSLAQQDFIYSDDFVDSWRDNCNGGAAFNPNDEDDYEQLYATNAHEDGIDIYLLPDDGDFNWAFAFGVPGTAFMVGGYFGAEQLPFRSTRTFTHEMGHCLGLSHTWHGTKEGPARITCGYILCDICSELVNGDMVNLESCGDYVWDTPADPSFNPFQPVQGITFNVNNCEWTNTVETDINGDLIYAVWHKSYGFY